MVLSWIFCMMVLFATICAVFLGNGAALASSIPVGAQSGITLALSLAGSICLWTGIGKLMEHAGITKVLSRFLSPLLHRLFPSTRQDAALAEAVSGNICANFLGLGNAATPMGIRAVGQMAKKRGSIAASDEMCRFIVLNTASIQFIPANVTAIRAGLGSVAPFDILPAVWISSLCSATCGIAVAYLLGKVCRHG